MKYYAVKVGKNQGIYNTWEECENEIKGFKGAQFKSFSSYEEAINYLNERKEELNIDCFAYVDGSYDKDSERYSFGCVLFLNNEEIHFSKAFDKDEYSQFRNVAGEVKGASFIINYLYKRGIRETTLFYDYLGIEKWYTNQWKANATISKLYVDFAATMKDKIKVNFVKVKSHTNNKYNDLADKLAKDALGIK